MAPNKEEYEEVYDMQGREREFAEFYTNGTQPSGRQKYHGSCIPCEESYRKEVVEVKRKVITQMFGDKCSICEYDKCFAALDFHHIDPTQKEFKPAHLLGNFSTVARMITELEKCIMVCANCHRELHSTT